MTPADICATCKYKQTCPGYGTPHALDCAERIQARQDRATWQDYRDYLDTRRAAANGTL